MAANLKPKRIARFGVFEADLQAGELRKSGLRIKLQDQPFQILATLLERPGEVVTREELQQRLWPADTFVEFEHSLNTAVKKLRAALGDDADTPRFIETIPRRGYRFLGPADGGGTPIPLPQPGQSRVGARSIIVALSVLLLASVVFAVVLWLRTPNTAQQLPLRTFTIVPEGLDPRSAAISPDGRYIAYVTGVAHVNSTLWVHDLERDERRAVAGPGYFDHPFWSPGNEFVGFSNHTRMEVLKVPVGGGPVVTICRTPFSISSRGTWNGDGNSIVVAANLLFEVSSQGGTPKRLLGEEKSAPSWDPLFLPGQSSGRRLIAANGEPGATQIVALDLDTGSREMLGRGQRPVWSRTGHLIYEFAGTLWAMPFSAESFKRTGEPFAIAENAFDASVALDGTLAYMEAAGGLEQLVWRDRSGKEVGVIGQPQKQIMMLALSPDGREVVVVAWEGADRDTWIHSVSRGFKKRLTFGLAMDDRPIWSPKGDRISFSYFREGSADIFVQAADGSGQPEVLLATPHWEWPFEWTPDGKHLIYDQNAGAGVDILYLRRNENGNGYESVPFVKTPFDEHSPDLSPDGRFLAYVSDKSGRQEVYVQPFPGGGSESQVSVNGGAQPRWRGDGKELFYVEDGNTLVSVSVSTTPTFSVGAPKRLFQGDRAFRGRGHQYDVTRDGQRFVVVKTLTEPRAQIRVVQNWFARFKNQQRTNP